MVLLIYVLMKMETLFLPIDFNFNDAKDIKNLSDAKNAVLDIFGEKGLYKKIRKVGTYAGSEEGEGSPIELNLGKYDPKA